MPDMQDVEKIVVQKEEQQPIEVFKLNFSEEDVSEAFDITRRNFITRTIVMITVFAVIIGLIIASNQGNEAVALFLGMAIMWAIFWFTAMRQNSRVWKQSSQRICSSTYEYKVFEEELDITIYNAEGRAISKYIRNFDEIGRVWQTEKLLLVEVRNESFLFKKSELNKENPFYLLLQSKLAKNNEANRYEKSAKALVIASEISIMVAMVLYLITSKDETQNSGMMFFVLLPIPVSSVIYGLMLKAKDYNYMKSLVIGIITAVVLILCGITFAS